MESITATELAKLRRDFLQDTVNYYNENPKRRSRNDRKCYYNGANAKGCEGDGCAIGRVLPLELRKHLDERFTNGGVPSGVRNVFGLLPDSLKVLECEFLERIQEFHDYNSFWDDESITSRGASQVDAICDEYQLEPISF